MKTSELQQQVNTEMDVIVFIPKLEGAGSRLLRAVDRILTVDSLEIICSLESLKRRLRRPVHPKNVLILMVPDHALLNKLVAMRMHLENVNLVLILPEGNPEMISKGHGLRPRYLVANDENFSDLPAIFKKYLS